MADKYVRFFPDSDDAAIERRLVTASFDNFDDAAANVDMYPTSVRDFDLTVGVIIDDGDA